MNDYDPKIIFVSECELANREQLEFVNIPNYTLEVSVTFNTGKARSCCYVKNGVKYFRQSKLEDENLEMIVIDMEEHRYIGIYRPFKIPSSFTKGTYLKFLLNKLSKAMETEKQILCLGDFNINRLGHSGELDNLQEWEAENGLTQLLQEVTRYRVVQTKNGTRFEQSLIDHVYATHPDEVSAWSKPSVGSDHELIIAMHPDGNNAKKEKSVKRKLRDWRNYCPNKLSDQIRKLKDHELTVAKIQEIFEKMVPLRVIRFKPKLGQIANTRVERLKKKRDRCVKKFKKTKNTNLLSKARELTKRLGKLIKKEIRRVTQKKAQSSNNKCFWEAVNGFLGKNQRTEIELDIKGIPTSCPVALANSFQDHFIEKVTSIASLEIRPLRAFTLERPTQPLVFTSEELSIALKSVKNKRCHGIDQVPLCLMKEVCQINQKFSLKIFNQMAKYGLEEHDKIARVIPLFKKGKRTDINNYRPISNLNSITKIYEKLLLAKLEKETFGIESDSQHGFRKSHSTVTAGLEIQSCIGELMDEGQFVIMYSMDLSAAFDLLRPDVFFENIAQKLSEGLRFSIMDFLTNRKMAVEVDGHITVPKDLKLGCVQGSTLGPRLFTLYCSRLKEKIMTEYYTAYADDSYVITYGETLELATKRAEDIAQRHISELEKLGMRVNESKTEVMTFHKNSLLKATLKIGTSKIKSAPTMRILGILFDDRLNWKQHVNEVVNKATIKLNVIKHMRKFFTSKQFANVITSQIFSRAYYASPVWLNECLNAPHWKRLNAVHYRALRMIVGDTKRKMSHTKLNAITNRAPPRRWSNYATASITMKILRDELPRGLHNEIKKVLYVERRKPKLGRFRGNTGGKYARTRLPNRLMFMHRIKRPWLNERLNDDRIRKILKETYFDVDN